VISANFVCSSDTDATHVSLRKIDRADGSRFKVVDPSDGNGPSSDSPSCSDATGISDNVRWNSSSLNLQLTP